MLFMHAFCHTRVENLLKEPAIGYINLAKFVLQQIQTALELVAGVGIYRSFWDI